MHGAALPVGVGAACGAAGRMMSWKSQGFTLALWNSFFPSFFLFPILAFSR
jgi:hypothetical protein